MAPQFNKDQWNFLMLEYNKRKGKQNFYPGLFADYQRRFPAAKIQAKSTIKNLLKKQEEPGTLLNCNKASSSGESHSGKKNTVITPENLQAVKGVLDRDMGKRLGDVTMSTCSTARKNKLGLPHMTRNKITKKDQLSSLQGHPPPQAAAG